MPASLSHLKNGTVTHVCRLSHTAAEHLADIYYVSAMQVTLGAFDGALQLIGEQTEGQSASSPGPPSQTTTDFGLNNKEVILEVGSSG